MRTKDRMERAMNRRNTFLARTMASFKELGHEPLTDWVKGRWGFHTHCKNCGANMSVKKSLRLIIEFPGLTCEDQIKHIASLENGFQKLGPSDIVVVRQCPPAITAEEIEKRNAEFWADEDNEEGEDK